ncbi:MarR family winged helix-turn-helix transcriptional regulator [Nocardioides sp.]|jgi:DNA-binding MarR family transcriptional regulator|uniref:MarR family winged helix-turn-helix transcriptional regulator n=1 Tax=Nocardioides sp. TaxID=35761 RepID=UPI002D05D61C|nr:MarR family transcriptional regulator [Nocardioides sp.]HVX54997.1 MarR family transcriptional regulator [Nocardioides sp.]
MSDLEALAAELRIGVSLLYRRLKARQIDGVDGMPSIPELAALVRLDRGGPATNADLAKAEQISPQSMSATLAGLERRGLIERASDPRDGRRVLLSVTAEGRATIEAKRAVRTQQIAAALGHLAEEEIAALRAAVPALERLAENL